MQFTAVRDLPFIFVILFSLLFAGTSFGAVSETTLIVEPGADYVVIHLGGGTAASYEDPQHGTLTPVAHGFHYTPNDEFWAVGHDVVMVEVQMPRAGAMNHRYILAAGRLSLEDNTVYAMQSQGPNVVSYLWNTNNAPTVTGTVEPLAYELDVDTNDPSPPAMQIEDGNTTGHQQTSEHVVNVTVDDLDLSDFPMLMTGNELPFYRIKQGQMVLLELRARFNFGAGLAGNWQVRAYSPGIHATEMDYKDITPGFYSARLVRWGTPGDSGADFYLNDEHMGTITSLPFLLNGPVTYELLLEQTPEFNGLKMNFENPLIVSGTTLTDRSERLAFSTFENDLNGVQGLSNFWDIVEGDTYMSRSPQTLPGLGDQLDIDMGAIPHWEHAYLRQDFVSDPLTNYKARFWMNPSALNMPEGQSMRLVYGCRNSAANWCVDFRLGLSKVNGQFELNLYTWEDNGTMHTINYPITNAPQWIGLRYETSAGTNVSTGWAELWVNGVSAGTVRGLANHNSKVEDVRFGSNYTSVQVTGILSLDEIYTWHH